MADAPETVFKFTAEGVDLEFAGSEEFVERQVVRFRQFLASAVGVEEAAEAPAARPAAAPVSFETFCKARPVREGRGAIQDRILLAIYYMNVAKKKRDVSGDDIMLCFRRMEWDRPKNLHNALGILKRKLGYLQEGSGRGLYQLAPKGLQYVEGRFQRA